jgi:hypothetical protein
MTDDDLQTKFAVLTDARPEPSDPAAPIRLRIRRRQRRRRGTAAVLVTAAAVTVTLAAGPALGALQGGAGGGGGFAAPPTPTSSAPGAPEATNQIYTLPLPWSDKKFTKLPDANGYPGGAYYVAQGRIPTESWAILSTNKSCLVGFEDGVGSFGTPFICFTDWADGRKADFTVLQGHSREKSTTKIDHTLVIGAVSIKSSKVRIVAGGKTYSTDAVGTPTTDQLRFFAIEIPKRDLRITSITPLDAAGRPAAAPANPPGLSCPDTCSTATSSTPTK